MIFGNNCLLQGFKNLNFERKRLLALILMTIIFCALCGPYLQSYILPYSYSPAIRGIITFCYLIFIAVYAVSMGGLNIGFDGMPRTNRLLGVWVVVGLVGVCFSSIFYSSLIRELEWIGWILFCFSVSEIVVKDESFAQKITILVPLGFMFCTLLIIIKWSLLDDPHNFRWAEDPEPFSNIRHIGYYAVGAFVCSFQLFFDRKLSRFHVFIIFALGLYSLAFVFWTGGRGAMVSVLVVSLLALVFSSWNKRLIFYLLLVFPLAILLSDVFWVKGMSFGFYNSASLSHGANGDISNLRFSIWSDIPRHMSGHWLFGLGADGYNYVPKFLQGTVQPHNVYIQFITDWGVIGGLCFISFLAIIVVRGGMTAFGDRLKGECGAYVVGLLLLCSMGVHGLFDGTFYHALPLLLSGLGLAMTVPLVSRVGSKKLNYFIGSAWSFVCVAALLLPIVLHLIIIKVQWYPDEPMPQGESVKVVRLFPSDIARVPYWVASWKSQGLIGPEEYVSWLQWIQRYSNKAWHYAAIEAGYVRRMGNSVLADELERKALEVTPDSDVYRKRVRRLAGSSTSKGAD